MGQRAGWVQHGCSCHCHPVLRTGFAAAGVETRVTQNLQHAASALQSHSGSPGGKQCGGCHHSGGRVLCSTGEPQGPPELLQDALRTSTSEAQNNSAGPQPLSVRAASSHAMTVWHHHQAASMQAGVQAITLLARPCAGWQNLSCSAQSASSDVQEQESTQRYSCGCGHLMCKPLRASLPMSASASAVMPSYSMPLPLSSKLRRVVFICNTAGGRVAAGLASHGLQFSAAWQLPAQAAASTACLRDIKIVEFHCQRASSEGHGCSPVYHQVCCNNNRCSVCGATGLYLWQGSCRQHRLCLFHQSVQHPCCSAVLCTEEAVKTTRLPLPDCWKTPQAAA